MYWRTCASVTRKQQGGFTLLELLIVIVIIGILALVIIPNITSAPKKARAYVNTYTPANTNSTYTIEACLENDGNYRSGVVAAVSPCDTKTFQVVKGDLPGSYSTSIGA